MDLICALFTQFLQLSVSAPLSADFPVDKYSPSCFWREEEEEEEEEEMEKGWSGNTSLKMSQKTCPPQDSSSLFIHINLKRTQEKEETQSTQQQPWVFVFVRPVILGAARCWEICVVLRLLNPLTVEQLMSCGVCVCVSACGVCICVCVEHMRAQHKCF